MKILIVEDEHLSRENISLILKDNHYGPVIEASNGKEALKYMEVFLPELVITDIRMPLMDGLEFIEAAKKLSPSTLYVILSSYDMFEYARKAIALGVYAYLLKPFKTAELLQCVAACRDIIQTSVSHQNNLSKEYFELTRRKFIFDLVQNHLSDDSYIKDLSEEYGLCRLGNIFVIAEILIDNYSSIAKYYDQKDKNALNYGLENVALEILSALNIAAFAFDYQDGCGLLLNLSDINTISTKLLKAFNKIKESISLFTAFTITVCIGEPVTDLKNIYHSEASASDLSLSRLVTGGNSVYTNQVDVNKTLPIAYFEDNLALALNSGNFDKALKIILDIYQLACGEGYPCILLSKLHLNIIITLFTTLENMSISLNTSFGNELAAYNHLRRIVEIENVFEYYHTIINYAKNQWGQENQTQNQILINRAKNYIAKNYMNDISLAEIAGFCNLSPSYFSKLFKECCHKTFITYLNEFRIQKALELLNTTPMHINEIAGAVGYQDNKYFHRSFKKIVGISPGKYRTTRAR